MDSGAISQLAVLGISYSNTHPYFAPMNLKSCLINIYIALKTLQIKMLPTEELKDALIDTFIKFNGACNFVSRIAFEKKPLNKVFLQRIVYKGIREKFGISAQLGVRAIAKAVETYKVNVSPSVESAYGIIFLGYDTTPVDPGICSLFPQGMDEGRKLENVVYLELLRRGKEVYYYRERDEVDLMVRGEGLIEVSLRYGNSHVERLKRAMESLNLKEEVLITWDEERDLDDVKVIPAWRWLSCGR